MRVGKKRIEGSGGLQYTGAGGEPEGGVNYSPPEVTFFPLARPGRPGRIGTKSETTRRLVDATEDVVEIQAQLLPQTKAPNNFPRNPAYVDVLSITPQKGKVEVVVRFPSGAVHTAELPGFAESLAERLPSILATRCHSGSDGLFAAELPHTETGHVLEHAILAHLERQGLRCRAVTEWNWRREPWGTFHIALFGKEVGLAEALKALSPAVAVVETAIAQSLTQLSAFGRFDTTTGISRLQMQPGRLNGGEDPEQG